jgi:hypothetical protein
MHGLVCATLEAHLRASHGPEIWQAVRADADLPGEGFEPLLIYDPRAFDRALAVAAARLGRSEGALLEDLGVWVCTHPPLEAVRRLFRFCGSGFTPFLLSLEELGARVRMSLPNFDPPAFSVRQTGPGRYEISAAWSRPGAGAFLTGLLHAMASDYGALVTVKPRPGPPGATVERLQVHVVREGFHAARGFALAEAPP